MSPLSEMHYNKTHKSVWELNLEKRCPNSHINHVGTSHTGGKFQALIFPTVVVSVSFFLSF